MARNQTGVWNLRDRAHPANCLAKRRPETPPPRFRSVEFAFRIAARSSRVISASDPFPLAAPCGAGR